MTLGRVTWQCHVGEDYHALLWADCDQDTSAALERAWVCNSLEHLTVAEWPNYTFCIGLYQGQRVFVQKNTETGTERQLRRIILMMS